MVLYSVPTQLQYDNFADDRARGLGHNPFGNYTAPYTVRPANNELAFGPSAGDESFMAYTLYSDSALTHAVGSAVFVCVYGLTKNASCNASFEVGGGSIAGVGTFPFDAMQFMLAVTGGTAGYRGVKGLLVATPSAAASAHATPLLAHSPNLMGQAQRLTFSVAPPTGARPVGVTAFSFPVEEQYLDHNDDEARGDSNNPYGSRVYKQCLSLTHPLEVSCSARLSHMASVAIDEHSDGP
jgi:hypothetical protein